MRKEELRRIRTVMEGHLEVIGTEVRKMMLEMAVAAFRDCRESDLFREVFGGTKERTDQVEPAKENKDARVKKVSIE